MKIAERYLMATVLKAIGGVTVMLVGLQLFILFVGELSAIGKGEFGLWQAFVYVLMLVPSEVYLFFPVASLLGALLGLGVLANHSELIVLRASGMSVWQVIKAVLMAALLLVLVVTVLGETVVPTLMQTAEETKAGLLSGGQTLRTNNGLWLRQHTSFIHIGEVESPRSLSSIYQYRFNDKQQMVLSRFAAHARFQQGVWQLFDVHDTELSPAEINSRQYAQIRWDLQPPQSLFSMFSRHPEWMSLMSLSRYINAHKRSHLDASDYELSFWGRLCRPLSTVVMMLLAIPFIFGPLRNVTMGARFVVGSSVGFSFHMLNQFFAPVSQVFQLSAVFSALLPTILFAFVAVLLIQRVR